VRDVIFYIIIFLFSNHFENNYYEKVINKFYNIDVSKRKKRTIKSFLDIVRSKFDENDGED